MTLLAGHVVVTVAFASPLCAGIFYHILMPCKKSTHINFIRFSIFEH